MSVDLCLWKSGDGTAEELYADAADGVTDRFHSSGDVTAFRSALLGAWPELAHQVEPLDFDPDLDLPPDPSLYVLITLPARQSDLITDLVRLALEHGLAGYDPQTGSALT